MTAPIVQQLPPLVFPDTPLPDIVELRDVSQVYGATTVLDHLNFRIEDKAGQGEFVVVLGPSGCGKSTLLRYIAGLQTPTSGQVLLNGQPRTERDVVGMVFQQYSPFPWRSVLRNVTFGLELRGVPLSEAKERAMEAIVAVGLEGHENKFCQYPKLSGGQLQRVAIARSLVVNPKVLLMDEPFGALDTNTRFKMQLNLWGLWEKLQSTIIFVTHDIQEAVFLGDDVYIMQANPGRVVNGLHIDLPLHRDRATKRSPRYVQLVNELEDRMMALDAVSSSTR